MSLYTGSRADLLLPAVDLLNPSRNPRERVDRSGEEIRSDAR